MRYIRMNIIENSQQVICRTARGTVAAIKYLHATLWRYFIAVLPLTVFMRLRRNSIFMSGIIAEEKAGKKREVFIVF